jgi:hypothetical protein
LRDFLATCFQEYNVKDVLIAETEEEVMTDG